MFSLTDSQKRLLLETARKSIVAAIEGHESSEILATDPELRKPSGVFVTLHRAGRLRGCIGQLPGKDELIEVVKRCAALAALEDPRFSRVRNDELPGLDIEISVLSDLVDIEPPNIVPGKHGLLVSREWERGILLPQVATQMHWGAERFLEETCGKAGLNPGAWKEPGTRIQAFTAEVFSEADLRAREASRASYSIST
jgi:AmmeMemoRadiSam system protein A